MAVLVFRNAIQGVMTISFILSSLLSVFCYLNLTNYVHILTNGKTQNASNVRIRSLKSRGLADARKVILSL
jgi:hypothetical protein